MRTSWIASCLVLLCSAGVLARNAEIDTAIERGRAFLYGAMNEAGHWEVVERVDPALANDPQSLRGPQWSGRTAVVVYALLRSGEKPVEPRLQRAIEFLKQSDAPTGTYALAFRCLVWASLPQTQDVKRLARRDADRLAAGVNNDGLSGYFAGINAPPDMSNSQIALLGLFAARESGVEVPSRYWRAADRAWRARQLREGAWTYGPDYRDTPPYYAPHPGMTAAGAATLLLIRDALSSATAQPRGNEDDPAVNAAIRWLSENFEQIFTFDFAGNRALYGLYMTERLGIAGGVKRFGDHVWYERGTRYLLPRQTPEGAWVGGVEGGGEPIVDTAFALMFLSHARAPVAINKLRYDTPAPTSREAGNWNQRSRDVARVTEWMSAATERKQRWQIVSLDRAEDLYDAPVLFVSGDQAIDFNAEQLAALRDYVHAGGLIVFSADARNRRFIDAATRLGTQLAPQSEWRRLEPTHPLLRWQQFNAASWRRPVQVMGIGNGVREFALLLPDADISRSWQAGAGTTQPEHLELAANIVQYAGSAGAITQHRTSATDLPRTLQLWHLPERLAEPGALSGLATWLATTHQTALATAPMGADPIPPDALVFVSVSGNMTIPGAQLAGIRQHVERSGHVVIEAIDADEAGVLAAEALVRQVIGDAQPIVIPDPLAGAIRLRDFVRTSGRQIGAPESIYQVGASRVVVSKVNLSSGLAGARHEGVIGLTIDSSRAILRYAFEGQP